jgi:hypothetical protein
MTTFAVEMGIIGDPQYPEKPYNPSLPILPIFNLFNRIHQEDPWQIPNSLHQQEDWEELLLKWGIYLNQAILGNLTFLIAMQTNIVDGSLEDTQAAEYFNSELHVKTHEEGLEKVLSVRRAFVALLSEKSKKYLKWKDDEIHASPEDIQNARTLVSNFERSISYINLSDDEEIEDGE